MLGTIVGLIIIGFFAGLIARALVPGKQSMTILQTILLGVIGSFVGGFLGRLRMSGAGLESRSAAGVEIVASRPVRGGSRADGAS